MSKRPTLSGLMAVLPPALPPLLLTLGILAATWKLAFADRIIARGDLLLYFYPLRQYASQALREGRLPLWNPYTFMGAPFLANSQAGFFYPLNMLMAWLPTEQAVSYSIVLHLIIAAVGMYGLARLGLKLGRLAALTSAIAFGLGGYLGAQVEHLNQLQGLAWLPLQVLIVWDMEHRSERAARSVRERSDRFALKPILLLSLLIALQVLAGHTQSLYICLIALAVVALLQVIAALIAARLASPPHRLTLSHLHPLLLLAVAGALAALVCAGQLLPTLELSRESSRSGGLSLGEVASFSWRPWVIGRALMPTYGDALFPEFVAYIGAGGLALAVLGAVGGEGRRTTDDRRLPVSSVVRRPSSHRLLALTFMAVGFVLALGIVTPLFNLMFYWLPGFNLFRAQARWLVVFALGISILIGLGVQALRNGLTPLTQRLWLVGWVGLMGLVAGSVILGARISPEPEYASLPARRVLMGWAIAAGLSSLLVMLAQLKFVRLTLHRPLAMLFALAVLGELLAAAQYQPYARAADREALTGLRPATAHLLAGQQLGERGRVLALSGLFFDPGDLPEQTLIYQNQLDKDERYDRVIASKQKEVLSPNLSLYYQLPSVDGYDGGLLPIRRFVTFAAQFTTTPKTGPSGPSDGRLREFLKAVPANIWLEQMAVRYLIVDKTQDIFVDGVYYDMLLSAPISPSTLLTPPTPSLTFPLAPYTSTALGLVVSATQVRPNQLLASGQVQFADGSSQPVELRAPSQAEQLAQPYFEVRFVWAGHRVPTALTLTAQPEVPGLTLRGLTSIDDADHSFLSQMIQSDGSNEANGHTLRVVHSGDVKIYENLAAAPRALLRGTSDAFTQTMTPTIEWIDDAPERVVLRVRTAAPAQLVLRDACYPGWVARVDGRETPITCADILFRQIEVPASSRSQEIIFSYEPQSVRLGLLISGMGLLLWLVLALITVILSKKSSMMKP